jgi:hypothetical protein
MSSAPELGWAFTTPGGVLMGARSGWRTVDAGACRQWHESRHVHPTQAATDGVGRWRADQALVGAPAGRAGVLEWWHAHIIYPAGVCAKPTRLTSKSADAPLGIVTQRINQPPAFGVGQYLTDSRTPLVATNKLSDTNQRSITD